MQKNELKAACIRAGKIHTATKYSATNAGSTIDKLLFDAIKDVFDELQTSKWIMFFPPHQVKT